MTRLLRIFSQKIITERMTDMADNQKNAGILGKVLLGAGGLAAVGAGTSYGVSEYFFRRTIIRQNARVERTMKMAGTAWDEYMPLIKERHKWVDEHCRMIEVDIMSADNLKLHAYYYPVGDRKKTIICFHGYTSSGRNDFNSIAKFFIEMGYSLLCVDERAHGKSEGKYIGFGCLDRFDALEWINYVKKQTGDDAVIFLYGISMGGATVLMTSGQNLDPAVKGIISDCAFTSAWDVFSWVLKSMYHMPEFPVMYISDMMCRQRAGYGLKECNSAEEVKKAKVPILFIHGDADTFVPCRMCGEIYANCASPKEKIIIKGAGHAESYYRDTELYESAVRGFIDKYAD